MTSTPERIGRFHVRSPLGKGGMGTLFLAWDPELERDVAIKVLYRDDEGLRERFRREARSVARLRHPNIVTVFDVGEHDGRPFIAMEYVPGETLAQVIRERRPVGIGRRIEWMEELCDGLAYAHEAGIVHRDIKPANLMVGSDGVLKILDFGVARVAQAADLTQDGGIVGTLNYMSPEQVAGQGVDRRSDVFAVGAVLYEILSYRQAFPGTMSDGILHEILHGAPEPLERDLSGIDSRLITVVERAMSKKPQERYPDLGAMKDDLHEIRSRLDDPAGASETPASALGAGRPHPGRRGASASDGRADPGRSDSGRPDPGRPDPGLSDPGLSGPVASGEPLGAGAAGASSHNHANSRPRSRAAFLALAGVAAALILVPAGLWMLGGADPVGPNPIRLPPAEATPGETGPAETTPDASDSAQNASAAIPDTIQEPPPNAPPVEPVPTTVPPECARLLERASLGEPLTEAEEEFLAQRCRQ